MQVTPEYLEYVQLLLARHRLILEDDDPEYEIESIEEKMTQLWGSFDCGQRAGLNGISSDLAWLRGGGQNPPMGRKPEDVSAEDVRALVESDRDGDWHAHLHWIRMCQAKYSPSEVAMRRSSAYGALGFHEIADLFDRLVRDLGDPDWTRSLMAPNGKIGRRRS